MLNKLTSSGNYTTNVYCGLIKGSGERVTGCGKLGRFKQYYYEQGGCTSSVSLCDECAKVEEAKSSPDPKWHQYNIEHDESVF